MKRLMKFLANHGETIFYSAVIAFATGVLGPSLEAHDEAKHMAHIATTKE